MVTRPPPAERPPPVKRPPPAVLITRPEDSARELRQELEAKGYATMVEPLLTIESFGKMSALSEDVQALALTSANAVPALTDEARRLPIFTVGKATADAASAAGCSRVISGDGDAAELAGLIGAKCRKQKGAILHLSGEVVHEDLQRTLSEQGFDVRRKVVYRALPSNGFSDELLTAWRKREIAAVLLFSPRTADILVRLLIDHHLTCRVDTVSAICLSEATATPCRALVWKEICLAARPNRDALIRALEGSIGIC
ncbi:MAG: uroporphyrinogen-III synthase [Alphaproteobacteria bacterium]|nr:uroporphyrinogen-III synthase [Alphaproteobacteria bacterium]